MKKVLEEMMLEMNNAQYKVGDSVKLFRAEIVYYAIKKYQKSDESKYAWKDLYEELEGYCPDNFKCFNGYNLCNDMDSDCEQCWISAFENKIKERK